jgi:exodeoxyribonuclease VII small subunit
MTGTAAPGPPPEELGFAGCLEELTGIIAGLERDEVDVDHLGERVERAAELIAWCRHRLDATRLRVEEVLERLEPGDGDGPDGRAGEG